MPHSDELLEQRREDLACANVNSKNQLDCEVDEQMEFLLQIWSESPAPACFSFRGCCFWLWCFWEVAF